MGGWLPDLRSAFQIARSARAIVKRNNLRAMADRNPVWIPVFPTEIPWAGFRSESNGRVARSLVLQVERVARSLVFKDE